MPKVTIINPTIAAESDRKLRVAAYCRVSSSSEDQLNSYQAQLTYYSNKFNDSETEELVELYADSGITGTCDKKRTEFMRMINDCRRGKIDRIYAKSISRFARNTRDCLKYIRELKSLGITIMFEKENIDTAKMTDEIMITIMGGLAQEESVSISQNMRWSIQKRMRSGNFAPVSAPFGYDLGEKQLIVREDEAVIVADIFDYFVNGHGIQSTTEYINLKYNCSLAISSVRYILMNEKYIGDTLLQKSYTPDIIGAHSLPNNDVKDKYYIKKTHSAIISKEIFDMAQELLCQRYIPHGKKEIHPFTKKIRCGLCGCHYVRKRHNGKTYWVCYKHDEKAELCRSKQMQERVFEEAFIQLMNKLLMNYKEILLPLESSLQELRIKNCSANLRVTDIYKDIAQLREQSHVLANLLTKGFISEAKYHEQNSELVQKIKRKQKNLQMLTKSGDDALEQISCLVENLDSRDDIMTEFESDTFEFLVDKIIVVEQNKLGFQLIGGLKFTEEI